MIKQLLSAVLLASAAAPLLGQTPQPAIAAVATSAPVHAKLPDDSLAIGRKYATWFWTSQIDSIAAHTAEPVSAQQRQQMTDQIAQFIARAGTEQSVVEERWIRRNGNRQYWRIARFSDGSSDEDRVEARVGETLRTLRGRSVIRNAKGVATVDITIDVAGGRITGFSGLGDERQTYDERVELPPSTYFGPLIFLVIKNFKENATDGRLVFRTVVATPKPRVFDMELVRQDQSSINRRGGSIDTVHFVLRPTVNWLVDPIIRAFAPDTTFSVQTGAPPALALFEGPRNFAGQKIRIE